jgi:ADP-ribose pyrophosphatase YjhB (NUDIX family)
MSFTRYIVAIVIDPKTRNVVTLLKQKGPALLLGKVTFPGGKIEANESVQAAASRELVEESGVAVPESAWCVVGRQGDEHYELHVLAATSSEVHLARQLESEPVTVMNLDEAARQAGSSPGAYVPDFLPLLHAALFVLELDEDLVYTVSIVSQPFSTLMTHLPKRRLGPLTRYEK